ncbi:MAG: hypothetical protein ACREO8_04495 [Luteimonas sp.]
MLESPTLRDERTEFVENSSYRWAHLVLSYGVLASVAYRSFARHETSWDLLALVIVAGAVATLYQGKHRVLSRRWAMLAWAAIGLAVAIAASLVLLSN